VIKVRIRIQFETQMGTTGKLPFNGLAPRSSGEDRAGRGRLRRIPGGLRGSPYAFVSVEAEHHRFLADLFGGFGCSTLDAWVDIQHARSGFDRVGAEGLITGLVEYDGRTVAVAWSDFRVHAASYGRASARRLAAFLRYLSEGQEPPPLVYVVNSAGLSLMEGRTAFSDVFALWPDLLHYADEHLVLTCASGRCLGLAPILYGLGHYRVAIADRTQINLTGPEVIKLFFGEDFDFEHRAAAERCLEKHDLVHEAVPSIRAALDLFRALLGTGEQAHSPHRQRIDAHTESLLAAICDASPHEVVPGWSPRVRLFVGSRRGRRYGIFVNPIGQPNNMIDVRTLQKYGAGLDLFRAMRLPIVSLLDAPGIDPRFDQTDAGLIRHVLSVGERIIRYPYGKLGVVAGRCFGGATTLAFPKVFGGRRAVALQGTQFGVMHERIVEQVLRGSPRLLAQWREVAAAQGAGFEDLLAEGSLDAVVDPAELPGEIDRFLADAALRLRSSTPSLSVNRTRSTSRKAPPSGSRAWP
jgi:propionyl-CoA carboxylase beta chain